MKGNERIKKFLELQDKNIEFDYISQEIGITPKTLRAFLNRKGYKLENGKYTIKENDKIKQIESEDAKKEQKTKKEQKVNKENKKDISKKLKQKENKDENKKDIKKTKSNKGVNTKEKKKSNLKVKKDRKINITVEDMDKLCEVYDWYMQVKDYKSMQIKKQSSKKDIKIDNDEIQDIKSTSIKIDKKTWEDFERLCSNSQFSKQEILTQALKDFMKEYKHLL